MEGWIKLHRKLVNWEWYHDSHTFHLFVHLLLSANHVDKKWKGIVVKRGQLITGRIALSKSTGISVNSVRTCIKRLKSTSELTIKTTNKYSIITICNYEKYQITESTNDQLINQLINQQPTSNPPATHHKQEYKNDKNISFNAFWELYDKKRGDRKKLQRKWELLTNEDRSKVMEYVPKYKAAQPDKLFRKDPQTFLNNRSWNDEIIERKSLRREKINNPEPVTAAFGTPGVKIQDVK
jgi:hypothetical protein